MNLGNPFVNLWRVLCFLVGLVSVCLSGCAGIGVATGTYPKSGSHFEYRYAGTLFSKTDEFILELPDGTKLTMKKPDNSPILSAMAWGTAAGAAGKALDGVASEAIDAIK